ncbi:MAG TPA: hypothetical protein VGD73_25420 [Pseudonocardia sp.]|jgi:hypothetical protein|uniref:hypothetical protein n=1 Tax=Pseudonocardia sp. TaxID=60912 RepID=UPI002ED86139
MSKFNGLGIIAAVLLSAVVTVPVGLVVLLVTAVPAAATRLRPSRPRLRAAKIPAQLGAKWSQPAVPS